MVYSLNPRAFLTGFKETLAGHLVGVAGLIAGLVIVRAWQDDIFRNVQWAIAVYPTVLIAKAVMNGIFSGRLNTALHIGTITPRFLGNMRTLGRIFQRILPLTLVTGVIMSIVSAVLVHAGFLDVLVVVLATMGLGLSTYLFTLPITFATFKKGLDLDSVAYPIAATIADVLITICYAFAVDLFFNFGYVGKDAIVLVAILLAVLALISLPLGIRAEGFSKTMKTSISALMIVAVIASITGAILQKINVVLSPLSGNHPFYPLALFVAYPAIIELVGDAALVIGSTATTRLVLGLLEPYFLAMKNHALQVLGAWTASLLAFVPISAASLLLTGTFELHAFYTLTSVLLVANAFAMIAMTLLSYALAILTFKRSLDPDHLVVPIESSLAGMITSTALLAALFLLLHLGG